jgi:hypothetical protein
MIHLFGTSHSDFLLLQLVLNPDQVGFIFRGKVPTGQLVTNDPELCLIPVVEGLGDGEGLSGVRMAEYRPGWKPPGRVWYSPGGSGLLTLRINGALDRSGMARRIEGQSTRLQGFELCDLLLMTARTFCLDGWRC